MRLLSGILLIFPFLSGSHFFSFLRAENGDLPSRYPYPMSEFVALYICVDKFEVQSWGGGGGSCQLICWASPLSAVKCGPRYSLVTQTGPWNSSSVSNLEAYLKNDSQVFLKILRLHQAPHFHGFPRHWVQAKTVEATWQPLCG